MLICAHRLSECVKSFEIRTQHSSQGGNYFCFLVRVDSIWSSLLKLAKTLNSSWCSWWCSSRSSGGVEGCWSPKIFFFFAQNHIKNVFKQKEKKKNSLNLLGRGWDVQTFLKKKSKTLFSLYFCFKSHKKNVDKQKKFFFV